MSDGGISEVGARLVLLDAAAFQAKLKAATDQVAAFNKEQERAAELSKGTSKTVVDSAATQANAVKDSADTQVDATTRVAAANDAAATSSTATRQVVAASVATTAAHKKAMTTLDDWSGKILTWGSIAALAVGYEGVKKSLAFQQQMTQSAIDAGIKKSQLPALSKLATQVSDATGLAKINVADMIYRLASANPKIGMATKAMSGLVTQAANLYVLAGNTGNYDQIARIYGAVAANAMSLTHNGKALPYNAAGSKRVNEWALATVGHGDMKMGDLVAAMGTGVLPLAKTYGLSLNEYGAALDVMSPAMNASEASTRLKTFFGMLGSNSTKGAQELELFGGNATTMGSILRSKGLPAALAYMSNLFSGRVTGATFGNAMYGNGLGTITGGTKGMGTGASEFLRVYGFTPAQIAVMEAPGRGVSAFGKMTPAQLQAVGFTNAIADHLTGAQAVQTVQANLGGGFLGGGRTGAAGMQLLNQRGVLTNKLGAINAAETPAAYNAALSLAFSEPKVQLAKFGATINNLTIQIGTDLTPAVESLAKYLLSIGQWFGAHKTVLDAVLVGAGAVYAGAAVVKTVTTVEKIYSGVKTVFGGITGTASLTTAGTNLNAAAGSLQLAAKALGGAATKEDLGAGALGKEFGNLGKMGLGKFLFGTAGAIGAGGLIGYLLAQYFKEHPVSPKSPAGKVNSFVTGNHGQYAPETIIAQVKHHLLNPFPSHQATLGHDIGNWWDDIFNPKSKTKYPSGSFSGLPGSPLPMFGTAGNPFSAQAQRVSRVMGVSFGTAGTFDASMARAAGMKTASGQDRAGVNAAAQLVLAAVHQKDAADHFNMSAAQITEAGKTASLAVAKLLDSSDKQDTASSTTTSAANSINRAAQVLEAAANNLNGAASNAKDALLPSNIHNSATAGMRSTIARQ